MTTNNPAQAAPQFNNAGCLRPNEFIVETPCVKCGSLTWNAKKDCCASCDKAETANQQAKQDFNAKRRKIDLEREIRQIEREFEYDLVEY